MRLAYLPLAVQAAWNYNDAQGNNWPGLASDPSGDYVSCNTGSQSPIDLKTSFKTIKGGNDMWVSTYDQWGGAVRKFPHQTVKYCANADCDSSPVADNYFTSHYMLDMGSVGSYNVAQFHIHQPSEHTVNGEQQDLEIHWVHYAYNIADFLAGTAQPGEDYALASALGIMFSVGAEASSEITTASYAFLDWIKNDLETQTTADTLSATGLQDVMNDLLQAVDWNERWSYSGSLTTPPCTTGVQHNVLRTVVPAKQEHIQAIRTFTESQEANFYTDTSGNWREILDLTDGADAVIITAADPPVKMFRDLFVAFLILFIVAIIGFCVACYLYTTANASSGQTKEVQMAPSAQKMVNE